jgi:hypothetical protein
MDGILAPVLQISPEPLELGSIVSLAVATTPSASQSSASVDSGGVLVYSSEALFAKELCGLLANLEAASPRYGKDIAYVLTGKASEDLIKKVEKSLRKVCIRGKRRKRGVARIRQVLDR